MSRAEPPSELRYQAFYCEENAYWLCQHERFAEREHYAVFISNRIKQCVLMQQRIAEPGTPVCWDYHVVVLAHDPAEVFDLDTRLPMPVAAARYIGETFPLYLPDLGVRFRLVAPDELARTFASDRSHMCRADGSYTQVPPPWDCIGPSADGASTTLARYLDMNDDIAGEVIDLLELRRRYSR